MATIAKIAMVQTEGGELVKASVWAKFAYTAFRPTNNVTIVS